MRKKERYNIVDKQGTQSAPEKLSVKLSIDALCFCCSCMCVSVCLDDLLYGQRVFPQLFGSWICCIFWIQRFLVFFVRYRFSGIAKRSLPMRSPHASYKRNKIPRNIEEYCSHRSERNWVTRVESSERFWKLFNNAQSHDRDWRHSYRYPQFHPSHSKGKNLFVIAEDGRRSVSVCDLKDQRKKNARIHAGLHLVGNNNDCSSCSVAATKWFFSKRIFD